MNKPILVPELESVVQRLLAGKDRVVLALDGPCASGKTTLAKAFQERLGWTVVHMDDYFLRPEQRTPERYAVPGGNVDHERFLAEVLKPLSAGKPARVRPFDCKTMAFRTESLVEPGPVTLIEGAYACHPALWEYYDLRLFLQISSEEQSRRILQRNGPEQSAVFHSRWIPLEQAYFEAYRIPERCDYLLRI